MQSDRIIRKPQVSERTGLSMSTIRRLEIAGSFPKRIQLSKSAVGWVERDVQQWIDGKRQAITESE